MVNFIKTYSFSIRGKDNIALNDTASVLNSNNVTVTMGGKTANVTFGKATLNDKIKTFPLTINNFTGGNITVAISAGALVDASENKNKSVAKTAFVIDIIYIFVFQIPKLGIFNNAFFEFITVIFNKFNR